MVGRWDKKTKQNNARQEAGGGAEAQRSPWSMALSSLSLQRPGRRKGEAVVEDGGTEGEEGRPRGSRVSSGHQASAFKSLLSSHGLIRHVEPRLYAGMIVSLSFKKSVKILKAALHSHSVCRNIHLQSELRLRSWQGINVTSHWNVSLHPLLKVTDTKECVTTTTKNYDTFVSLSHLAPCGLKLPEWKSSCTIRFFFSSLSGMAD